MRTEPASYTAKRASPNALRTGAEVFEYAIALQGSGYPGAVLEALGAGAAKGPYDQLRAAYAYATAGGAVLLVKELQRTIADWDAAEKRWLISLDWGHTEPEALLYLVAAPTLSEVVKEPRFPAESAGPAPCPRHKSRPWAYPKM